MYSAMKDGQIKTGEAYSNSINTRSAKADVISKLERAGYSSISILAIEAGDPDMVGCDNTYCKQADVAAIPDYSVAEDDILNNGEHNMHVAEADDKEADDKKEEKSDDSTEDNESKADDEKEDSADAKEDGTDADDKKDDSEDDSNKKEETAEEPDEKLKDDKKEEDGKEDATDDKDEKELSAQEKTQLKDSYKKAFKATMLKCKYVDKCFDDLTLEEKVKFFETINKAWGNKADPSKFMTDKETEQLQKIVIKK